MLFACLENERLANFSLYTSVHQFNAATFCLYLPITYRYKHKYISTIAAHREIVNERVWDQRRAFDFFFFLFLKNSLFKFNGLSPFSSTSISVFRCRSIPFHFHIMYLKMNVVCAMHSTHQTQYNVSTKRKSFRSFILIHRSLIALAFFGASRFADTIAQRWYGNVND